MSTAYSEYYGVLNKCGPIRRRIDKFLLLLSKGEINIISEEVYHHELNKYIENVSKIFKKNLSYSRTSFICMDGYDKLVEDCGGDIKYVGYSEEDWVDSEIETEEDMVGSENY